MRKDIVKALNESKNFVKEEGYWVDMANQIIISRHGRISTFDDLGNSTYHCKADHVEQLKVQYYILTKQEL